MTTWYGPSDFRAAFQEAIMASKKSKCRVNMRVCGDCRADPKLHFVIKPGSSNSYLKWLNRNGQ